MTNTINEMVTSHDAPNHILYSLPFFLHFEDPTQNISTSTHL